MSIDVNINFPPFPVEESANIFSNCLDRLQANMIITITEQIRRMMPIRPRNGDNSIVMRGSPPNNNKLYCCSFFEPQHIENQKKSKIFSFFRKKVILIPCFIVSTALFKDKISIDVNNQLLTNSKTLKERLIISEIILFSDIMSSLTWNDSLVTCCKAIKHYIEEDKWLKL